MSDRDDFKILGFSRYVIQELRHRILAKCELPTIPATRARYVHEVRIYTTTANLLNDTQIRYVHERVFSFGINSVLRGFEIEKYE